MNFNIVSVNISEKKGTVKKPVPFIEINATGVKNDAHSGKWHRQVSLLGTESFEKFGQMAGRTIAYGEFAENITTSGMVLYETKPLDRFLIGETELEVTQIGKSCHGDRCAIYREVGNCVMPKEGIFCRVIKGGTLKAGDKATYVPKIFRVSIITLSDRAFAGEYEDRSGPAIKARLDDFFTTTGWKVTIERIVIPDEPEQLSTILAQQADTDLIFTTGGTGIGPRDFTVDVVKKIIDKEIPGIMELIRFKYGSEKPNALLSRSIAGVMGKSLIYCLPGSVKAVDEYLSEITKTIKHSIYMLHGLDLH